MTAQPNTLALVRLKDYTRAMINGHHHIIEEIEQTTGLWGYPPELVTVGLQALMWGKDAHKAIEEYCNDQ